MFKRHPLAVAVSSFMLITAAPAIADCGQELQDLQEKSTEESLSTDQLQSLARQVTSARARLDAGDEAGCMTKVAAARRSLERDAGTVADAPRAHGPAAALASASATQAPADPAQQDEIEIEAPPAQITVQQQPADVTVQEKPADIQVDLGQPVVEVIRNEPEVDVQNRPPEVDVHVKDPTATARVEKPEVQVETRKPEVEVESREPEVAVSHPEADVSVEQEDPTVSVRQQEPEVAVEQPQPRIDMKASEPEVDVAAAEPDIDVRKAQPEVDVRAAQSRVEMPPGETAGEMRAAQMAGGATDLASLEFNEGMASVAVSDLEGHALRTTEGAELGRINEVVTRTDDGRHFLVLQGDEAGEADMKLAPIDQLRTNDRNELRFEGERSRLAAYDVESGEFERLDASTRINFHR